MTQKQESADTENTGAAAKSQVPEPPPEDAAVDAALQEVNDSQQQQALPPTPGGRSDDASAVSNLTSTGDASVLSRTSASIVSVISQSLLILKGELPDEDRTDVGRTTKSNKVH